MKQKPSSTLKAHALSVLVAMLAALVTLSCAEEKQSSRQEEAMEETKMQQQYEDGPLFPKHRPGAAPEASIGGFLKLDSMGCIRIVPNTSEPGWTVIWPANYSLETGEGGEFRIIGEAGQILARQGDDIVLSGGLIGDSLRQDALVSERVSELDRRCPGGYVYVGRVM